MPPSHACKSWFASPCTPARLRNPRPSVARHDLSCKGTTPYLNVLLCLEKGVAKAVAGYFCWSWTQARSQVRSWWPTLQVGGYCARAACPHGGVLH